jgi:hypothetical protein
MPCAWLFFVYLCIIITDLKIKKMENLTVFCSVYVTTDYSIFRTLTGNREPKSPHVKRIAKSMKEKQLLVPIIVNEKMELIDGQHRFLACKSLGLPVYFIIQNGYSIPEVQRINTASCNWGSTNFVQSYIDTGNENYIVFKQFQDQFNLPVSCTMTLMGIESANDIKNFKHGMFSINKAGMDKAEAAAGWIKKLLPIYSGSNKSSFAMEFPIICGISIES